MIEGEAMTEIWQYAPTYLQILVDIILCVAIFAALKRMGAKRGAYVDRKLLGELKQLIDESRLATAEYMEALEEGRKSAEETAYLLMERERRGREVLERINKTLSEAANVPVSVYRSVEKMAEEGLDPREISRITGLNEGEVRLMIKLSHERVGK
ncbi:MAG TPA: hypothetical protein PLT64_09320 [Syntrophales bacterium]|nr:hypothetical protein [Syntrophales bacterium]HOL60042.1 hypothetical protein [Syntrophales bacterium]